MRIHDTLADRVVADVTLQHDDARADWVGTLVLMPSTTGEVLGMNVVSLLQDPTRHPEAADGMAGPLWTGADGLGWYRRVEQASD